jgi:hypothetical protein
MFNLTALSIANIRPIQRRVIPGNNQSADCSYLLTLVPRSQIFLPRKWRRYLPPKRRFIQDLHGATPQKTAFFIVTVVKTSDLTGKGCGRNLARRFFYPEDRGDTFFRNIVSHKIYTALHPRSRHSS